MRALADVRVCLALMMRDEARSIARLLESCDGVASHVVLLDTGSTDDTVSIARKTCEVLSLPLTVVHEPFVNFGATRNRCIELAEVYGGWVLMLSGDEHLEGAGELLSLVKSASADVAAFDLAIRMGDTSFASTRLLRSSARLRYVGPVHEYIEMRGQKVVSAHGPRIVHDSSARDAGRIMARLANVDLPLLSLEVQKPDCPGRWHFYYAKTLHELGRLPEALKAYQRRVEVGGWDEETFETWLRIGSVASALSTEPASWHDAYMAAYRLRPHRAEPLHALARLYWSREAWADALLYAMSAYSKKFPSSDRLFIDAEVYEWRAAEILSMTAWHVGENAIGLEASRKAYEARPHMEHLKRNLDFYATLPR